MRTEPGACYGPTCDHISHGSPASRAWMAWHQDERNHHSGECDDARELFMAGFQAAQPPMMVPLTEVREAIALGVIEQWAKDRS